MRFELRQAPENSPYENYLEVYITKGEMVRSFEYDSEESYKAFSQIVEMFTTPHCFHREVSFTAFQNIYQNLKSKTKYKGLTLGISVEYDYSINKLGQEIRDLRIALVS